MYISTVQFHVTGSIVIKTTSKESGILLNIYLAEINKESRYLFWVAMNGFCFKVFVEPLLCGVFARTRYCDILFNRKADSFGRWLELNHMNINLVHLILKIMIFVIWQTLAGSLQGIQLCLDQVCVWRTMSRIVAEHCWCVRVVRAAIRTRTYDRTWSISTSPVRAVAYCYGLHTPPQIGACVWESVPQL